MVLIGGTVVWFSAGGWLGSFSLLLHQYVSSCCTEICVFKDFTQTFLYNGTLMTTFSFYSTISWTGTDYRKPLTQGCGCDPTARLCKAFPSTYIPLGHQSLMLAWLCLKALGAILRCDRGLFCAGVCISVLMTGCSPPCPPEVWKFEGPLASFVLLLSPSQGWTWTQLV